MADRRELRISPGPQAHMRLVRRVQSVHKLLKKIGAMLVGDSRQAFQDQQFGDVIWPPTYPKQKEPTLNVAWTIKDFLAGRSKPDSRRFDNRPAGVATGEEPWQIAFQIIGEDTLELGTTMEGALGMQTGNVKGSIPVTDAVKQRINDWLYAGRRKRIYVPDFVTAGQMRRKYGIHWKSKKNKKTVAGRKGIRSPDGMETVVEFPNQKYEPKLKRFLKPTVTEYEIQGYARPFLGVTSARADALAELVQEHISGGR